MISFDDSTLIDSALADRMLAGDEPALPQSPRSGLAPLEMVLVLPLLMLFMGVIIVFGFAVTWKIRSEYVARDATWKVQHPRSHNLHPTSPEWPEDDPNANGYLNASNSAGDPIESFYDDDALQAALIRGPIQTMRVNSELLNFSRDVDEGVAVIQRNSTILPNFGRINYRTSHSILDDRFQYSTMSWRKRPDHTRRIGNASRRIPIIYEIPLEFVYDNGTIASIGASIDSLRQATLMAIDEDMEFYDWYKRLYRSPSGVDPLLPYVPPHPGAYSVIRDFHPRISTNNYRLDPEYVRRTIVEPFLSRIPRVPLTMARQTKSLYQRVLRYNERGLCQPPLTMQEQDQLQQGIEQLDEYIDRLNARAASNS